LFGSEIDFHWPRIRLQQSRLHEVATRTGKDPRQVVEEGIDRMLDYDEHFLAAV
jgi:hypothetical protein